MCYYDEHDEEKCCPRCRYEWVDNPPYCNWPRPAPPDPDSPEGRTIANYQRLFAYGAENGLGVLLTNGESLKGRRVKWKISE